MKLNFNIQNYLIFSLNNKHKLNYGDGYKLFYGIRQNKYIVNIVYFLFHLKRTLSFLELLSFNKGYIYFYNPTFKLTKIIFKYLYVFSKYYHGLLTNFKQLKLKINYLNIPKSFIIYNTNYNNLILNEINNFNIPIINLISSFSKLNNLNNFYLIPFNFLNKINLNFIYDIFIRIIFLGYKKRLLKLFNFCFSLNKINIQKNNKFYFYINKKNFLKYNQNLLKKSNNFKNLNIIKSKNINNFNNKKNTKHLKILKKNYKLNKNFYKKYMPYKKKFIFYKSLRFKSPILFKNKKKINYNKKKKKFNSYLNSLMYNNLLNLNYNKIKQLIQIKNLNFYNLIKKKNNKYVNIKKKKK